MTISSPVVRATCAERPGEQTPLRLFLDGGLSATSALIPPSAEVPLFNNALAELPHEVLEAALGARLAAEATAPAQPSLAAERSRARLERRLERKQR